MTDWQIIDSTDFPEQSSDERESPSPRSYRRWITLVGGILIFLILVGFMTLREWQGERRTAIREDLAAVIFEEETQQFLGNEEYAVNLMMPNSPQTWQQAYRQTFSDRHAPYPPGSIQLKDIDFDGECAVVTAAGPDGNEQVRNYCLTGQEWRRAPVPTAAWGDEQITLNVTDEVQLSFRPRDRAFGEALADELQFVFKELERWSFLPGVVEVPQAMASTNSGAPRALEIIIEPHDLHPPLVAAEDQRVVLNSPWLVPVQDQEGLSAEAAVRLALVNALLQRQGPFVEISDTTLPGAADFLITAQTIVAARMILAPEMHTGLLDTWRSQLNGQWVSPFFAKLLYPDDPILAQQAQVSALLLVDYIYESWGPSSLGFIIYQLPLVDSWDLMFQATLGRSTLELEEEAVQYAQTGSNLALKPQPVDEPLPVDAAFLRVDTKKTSGSRVYVELTDRLDLLLVELPTHVNIRTPDGTFLPTGCIPPGSKLEIDGEWLERYRRLRATQITVLEVIPVFIEPAPADTTAYMLDEAPPIFAALRDDGTLHPLIRLNPTLQVHPLPIVAGGKPHFMLVRTIPKCGRSWFVHYEPEQGITGLWLAPLPPMQWVWRADHQDLMFFSRRGDVLGNDIYQTNSSLSLQQIGDSNGTLRFIGWNTEAGQLISTNSWFGEIYIGLFDLKSGAITRTIQPPYLLLRSRRLSHDGNWLAHLAGNENLFGPADRLAVLDMNNGSQRTLIQVGPGEGLESPFWSLYLDHPTLAVLSGPVTERGELRAIRILVASPERPDVFSVAVEATDDALLAMPVFCSDGTPLYQVELNGQYQLQRQTPGLHAETLLTLDHPFQLLTCP